MGYNDVIHGHYDDISNLTTLLRTYMEIYRLLISSTAELNTVSLAKKSEVKHALDRINAVGDLMDDLIDVIEKCENSYIKYCFLKNEIIAENTAKDNIKNEIHNDLEFHN